MSDASKCKVTAINFGISESSHIVSGLVCKTFREAASVVRAAAWSEFPRSGDCTVRKTDVMVIWADGSVREFRLDICDAMRNAANPVGDAIRRELEIYTGRMVPTHLSDVDGREWLESHLVTRGLGPGSPLRAKYEAVLDTMALAD